jgi:hypothetical protein
MTVNRSICFCTIFSAAKKPSSCQTVKPLAQSPLKKPTNTPPQAPTPQKTKPPPTPSAPAQKADTPEKQTATSQEIPV